LAAGKWHGGVRLKGKMIGGERGKAIVVTD